MSPIKHSVEFSSVLLSLSHVWLSATPWTAAWPGFPVHQQLLEFTQTPTISSSVVPFSSYLQSFPASGSFPRSQLFASGGQSIGVSASTSFLPMNIQDWFPLGWTGWISLQSKGSQEPSPTPQIKSINSSALSFLYSPTLISIHNCWKNHSFDYVDVCGKSNVSIF